MYKAVLLKGFSPPIYCLSLPESTTTTKRTKQRQRPESQLQQAQSIYRIYRISSNKFTLESIHQTDRRQHHSVKIWMMRNPTVSTRGVPLPVVLLVILLSSAIRNNNVCNASSSIAVGHRGVRYNLIPRDDTRNTQETTTTTTTESPVLISFDGDIDAIRAKALAKANEDSVSEIPSSFTCENETTTHLEIVNWIYSIETVPQADVDTVFGEVSEITVDVVAPQTLTCFNNASSYANIVAMDSSIPGHEISTTETCQPDLDPSNKCTVIIGRMRVFLSNKDSSQQATALVLKHIQESYDDPTFVDRVNSGIVDITYFDNGSNGEESAPAPPIQDEDEADGGNDEAARESDSRSGLSSILAVAIGSAALVVFVGSVYFYRRRRSNNEDEDGVHGSAASRLANMTVNDAATQGQDDKTDPENLNRPASPYSEMVSSSYRFDRLQENSILSGSNMSPVYEMEGNETDNDTVAGGNSIMISEGGYTTDAGGTEEGDSTMFDNTTVEGSKYSSSQSQATPNVLGARPFPGTVGNFDHMEEVSDSDLDTSGEMSPVKMYVGNMLTNNNKLLVLPSGEDLVDDDNEDTDDSLLFGASPAPYALGMVSSNATTVQVRNNINMISSAPTDESGSDLNSTASSAGHHNGGDDGDVESAVGTMSRTSPMSQNTAPSF